METAVKESKRKKNLEVAYLREHACVCVWMWEREGRRQRERDYFGLWGLYRDMPSQSSCVGGTDGGLLMDAQACSYVCTCVHICTEPHTHTDTGGVWELHICMDHLRLHICY